MSAAIPDNSIKPGCRKSLMSCFMVTALVVVAFVTLLIYLIRMPVFTNIQVCQTNMKEISDALRRYYDVNGEYPPNLKSLKNDYLKDKSVLHCPLAKLPGDKSNYVYHRPGLKAGDDFVVLECNRHKIGPNEAVPKLALLKSGKVTVETIIPGKPLPAMKPSLK